MLLPGTCYVMSTEDRKGLVWNELPKSAVASILYVDKAAIEKLDSGIFKKVCLLQPCMAYCSIVMGTTVVDVIHCSAHK